MLVIGTTLFLLNCDRIQYTVNIGKLIWVFDGRFITNKVIVDNDYTVHLRVSFF